jgi:GT2 family glycosyltransferase
MKINLILPTYENTELTLNCLKSIKENIDKNYEPNIIWVDNNSSKKSKNIIQKYLHDNLSYDKIYLNDNIGFIKAVNIGLKFALEKYQKNKYIGIINNDIVVSENWLKNLILTLSENENLMLAGSASYNTNNNSISFDDLSLNNELNKISTDSFESTINNLKNNELNKKLHIFNFDDINDLNNALVPYYSVIFKTSIFKTIGFLNENFNMGYNNDTEFNFRILEKGYNIAKVFNSIVLHDSGSTFKLLGIDINYVEKSNNMQLKIIKDLNNDKKKKYVIYTCISGDYDSLKNLSFIDTEHFDYVCFTNSNKIKTLDVYPWKIIDVSNFDIGITKNDVDYVIKFARFFKTHPHLFFENYEKSIWIDGNINVLGEANDFIKLLNNDNFILVPIHPIRNNIYEELKACRSLGKETSENLNKVNRFLINENFPSDTKLVQTGIILRNHNDKKCIFFMNKWWDMIKDYSKRDQLSFNYVFWKYGGSYLGIPWDLLSKTYFSTNYRHGGL